MTIVGWGLVGSFALSVLTAVSSWVSIRQGMRTIKHEENEKAIANALVKDHVDQMQKSVDHAHEKIRDLYAKSNDTNIVIAELRTTMQETNRVMRQVEAALSVLSTIEARINAHIEAGRS